MSVLNVRTAAAFLLVGACTAAEEASACTHAEAEAMMKRMMRQVEADMMVSAGAYDPALRDSSWVGPLSIRIGKVSEALAEGKDEKVCTEIRKIATERHYKVE